MLRRQIKLVSLLSAALLGLSIPVSAFAEAEDDSIGYSFNGWNCSDEEIAAAETHSISDSVIIEHNGDTITINGQTVTPGGSGSSKKKSDEENGLYLLVGTKTDENGQTVNQYEKVDPSTCTAEMIYNNAGKFYYFSNHISTTVKLDLKDDTYTLKFSKTTGQLCDGIYNNTLYRNGIKQTSGDDRCAVKQDSQGNLYLVTGTGRYIHEGNWEKTDEEEYYVVVKCKVTDNHAGSDTKILRVTGKQAHHVAQAISLGKNYDKWTDYTIEEVTGISTEETPSSGGSWTYGYADTPADTPSEGEDDPEEVDPSEGGDDPEEVDPSEGGDDPEEVDPSEGGDDPEEVDPSEGGDDPQEVTPSEGEGGGQENPEGEGGSDPQEVILKPE